MLKILLPSLLLTAPVAFAQFASPIGTWLNPDQATGQVYACGDKLCAKILTLPAPNDPKTGKPRTDSNNPNAQLRRRPLQGLVFMQDLQPAGENKWDEGKIYDPKSGKTYACALRMVTSKTLEMKGYVGFSLLSRSQTWTRVN